MIHAGHLDTRTRLEYSTQLPYTYVYVSCVNKVVDGESPCWTRLPSLGCGHRPLGCCLSLSARAREDR